MSEESADHDIIGAIGVQPHLMSLPKKDLEEMLAMAHALANKLAHYHPALRIDPLNEIRSVLHQASPFKDQPVDNVQWVKSEKVRANDYNPNRVAPPEMKLLRQSIKEDNLTQPVVGFPEEEGYRVVDGFHRNTIISTDAEVRSRTHGYTPVVPLKKDVSNRMASTIRHNRARGTHSIELMVNIVGELKVAGMSDAWILRHIGMDADELLRLKQLSGLAELFKDREFTQAEAE